jgi:flagellar basal body-associated protein FliL
MRTVLKIGAPVLAIAGLTVFAWMFLVQAGKDGDAGKAADAVIQAADRAITSAFSDSDAEKVDHFINIGAIYTSSGNLAATLIVRGGQGTQEVCRRLIHVRDYLVVLLSDNPPDPANPGAGPANYRGSIVDALNQVAQTDAIRRVRFDSYHQASDPGRSGC